MKIFKNTIDSCWISAIDFCCEEMWKRLMVDRTFRAELATGETARIEVNKTIINYCPYCREEIIEIVTSEQKEK